MRLWALLMNLGAMTLSVMAFPAAADNASRVAVLLTDWAEPQGFDALYRREVVKRSFGARAMSPTEPCTEDFVGEFPFRVQLGLTPFAVGFPVPGLETVHDAMGLYRLSADGKRYISIYDATVSLAVEDIANRPELVTPANRVPKPLQRSFWAIDPRDGRDYLQGVVMIGQPTRGLGPNPLAMPNGIRDADEWSWAAAITDFSILHDDLRPQLSPASQTVESETARILTDLFAEQIDVRFGAYAPTEGVTRFEEDVALDFAREGFRRFVLVRETTDNNNYANNFMTRGYIRRALCLQGFKGGFTFEQARQVGRTPEYNLALLHLAKTHLDQIPVGSEVAVIYTTYGLPFPDRPSEGPFSAPHPWSKEVYHENAYNNYISFKRYLQAYFGDRYQLAFNLRGQSGDARLANYYAYGLSVPKDFTSQDPSQRFRTLRESIDLAKADGHRYIVVLLSHWYYNGRDPLLAIRALQDIPLNSREDLRTGKHWIRWCEARGSKEALGCDTGNDLVEIQYSETFDDWAKEFAIGYAHRVRGAIERYGVYPREIDLEILAKAPIDRVMGGTVRVTSGSLKGAQLVVAVDRYPGQPENFDAKNYRAFIDPADNLVSAWDDFEAYIATQRVPDKYLSDHGQMVSASVLFGPYRTLVNRPARITLPLRSERRLGSDEIPRLRAFVYNEVSGSWDPIFQPAGAEPLTYDSRSHSASFSVQVFGIYALAVTPPDWTPHGALRHRYPIGVEAVK